MLVNSNSPTPHVTPPNVFAKIVLGLVKMGATKYLISHLLIICSR
jgi:hypothetical protein